MKSELSDMFTNLETSENGKTLQFKINDLSTSVVNGLRRTILNDILNIGLAMSLKKQSKSIKIPPLYTTSFWRIEFRCCRLC